MTTSQLIKLGLSNGPSSPVRAKGDCCELLDHSVAGSSTAQPLEFCPKALQVPIHNQPMVSLRSFTLLQGGKRLGRPKTMDPEAMLQPLEANSEHIRRP